MKTLQRGWEQNLSELFQYADKELVISSPYISDVGAEFLVKNINSLFQQTASSLRRLKNLISKGKMLTKKKLK